MKTFEGFRGGTTQICSENEDVIGGGGGGESLHLSKIQRGDRLNFALFSPKSSAPLPPSRR